MRPRSALPRLVAISLLLAACGEKEIAVLQVGEIAYTAEDLAGMPTDLLPVLADLAAFGQAVAHGEATALGEPVVERQAERGRLAALPLELAAREMGIRDDVLQETYATDPEWELRVRHVVRLAPRWASDADRRAARARAEEVHRRARAGEDFAALAAQFSEEPGASQSGGLLDPGREGSWVAPFWEAARALDPGEISPVTETRYGYHVLRLEGRTPVPVEQADRRRLLARVVPEQRAAASLQRWAEDKAKSLTLEPPAILATRRLLPAGEAPDTLILAHWAGGRYSAWDFAVSRAALDSDERLRLDEADDAALGERVEADALETMGTEAAREMGIPVPAGLRAEAAREWEQRVAGLVSGLGFREGMTEDEVRAAALRALGATGQESRIARLELQALRPLLRRRYSVSGSTAPPPFAAASNSETPNRESAR